MASPYDVMIRLSLAETVTRGLATVIASLTRSQGEVRKLEEGLNRLAPAVIGAVAAFAGFETLKGIWDVAKASKELLNQQDQMERLGRSHVDVLKLTEKAYRDVGRAIPTASADEYLKTVRELRAVTGDWRRAEELAPKALMVDALLANIAGKTGETSKSGQYTEFYKLMRSAEMKGISTDETKLNQYTDKVFSLIQAFGGKLNAQDFQTLARRGGTAFINADIEKSLGAIAVMAADLGGATSGNALMSLYALQQGSAVLSRQQYHTLLAAGMIDPHHIIRKGSGISGKVQTMPGAITGGLDYAGNLPGWAHDVLRPHLMEYAEKVGDPGLVDEFFQSFWAKIIPNRKAAQAASMFSEPGFVMQQQKDLELARQGKSIEGGYAAALQRNPDLIQEAFSAQYKSMTEAIGSPVMLAAIPVMNGVREMFSAIGEFALANPGAITIIAKVVAGVAALTLVLGTLAVGAGIIALLPGGAIVVGIATFVTALGGLIAYRWDDLSKELSMVGDSFKSLYEKLRSYFGDSYETKNPTLKPESKSVLGSVADWWANKFHATQEGSRSFRNNNPGNIKFGSFAQSHGATGQDSEGFAVFPNEAAGTAAQRALWNSSSYANQPLNDALKRWGGYDASAVGFKGNETWSSLSDSDKTRLLDAQRKHEGWAAPGQAATGGQLGLGKAMPGGGLAAAEKLMGKNISDSDVQTYLATGRHPDPAKAAWCAYFVGATLNKAGLPSLNTGWATDYERYGHAATGKLMPYDVAVFTRGHGPGQKGGHVGILTGNVSNGGFETIEGNAGRGHRVMHRWHSLREPNLMIRRSDQEPPMETPPKPQHESAIHTHIYLDGKHIATNVMKHVTRAARYAGSVGRQDGRGQFMGPGAERFA